MKQILITFLIASATLGAVSLFVFQNIEHWGGVQDDSVGAKPVKELGIVAISTKMEVLFDEYGDYIQVTEDGRTLFKGKEINENRIKSILPPNIEIHTHEIRGEKSYTIYEHRDAERETSTTTVYGKETKGWKYKDGNLIESTDWEFHD